MAWNAKALLAGMLLVPAASLLAQSPAAPDDWEGLVRVRSQEIEFVYLAPGADFRRYANVMLDPSELAMGETWSLEDNRGSAAKGHATERDVIREFERSKKRLDGYLADAFAEAGFTSVRSPGVDVLRVRVGVFDIDMQNPKPMMFDWNRQLSENTGRATLVVEVRDSATNALLGRAVDPRTLRGFGPDRTDFNRLFHRWAEISANGLAELKAASPIDVNDAQLAR